jgi:hypothetical protein
MAGDPSGFLLASFHGREPVPLYVSEQALLTSFSLGWDLSGWFLLLSLTVPHL